jgi:hypothetical protein
MYKKSTKDLIKITIYDEVSDKLKIENYLYLKNIKIKTTPTLNIKTTRKVLTQLVINEHNAIACNSTMLELYVMSLVERVTTTVDLKENTNVEEKVKEKLNFYISLDLEMVDILAQELKNYLEKERTISDYEELCIFISEVSSLSTLYIQKLNEFMTSAQTPVFVFKKFIEKME